MKIKLMMALLLVCINVSGCQAIASIVPLDNAPIAPKPEKHQDSQTSTRVTRVVSGHTIEIQPTSSIDTLNQTIRLIGIQSPDYDQAPWGPEAKAYLEELLLGKTVQISFENETLDSQDSYSRQWAYVWLNGQLVNQTLIADGIVLEDERSPHLKYVQHFAHAQHRARILGLGIWNPDDPMRQTPHEFRQQQD